ncbi:MAG: DUF1700 domain-containing protein [Clostridia bacterium]|nr:DUF1700 domain-containing protein [Clostridia bacterium]
MTKNEFLSALQARLTGLPEEDVKKSLAYYSEMIDDRVEDGMTEEEAVSAVGEPDAIAKQIVSETPITKIVKERIKPKHGLQEWQIVLLVLGAPLWLPLLITAGVLIFVFFILLWVAVIVEGAFLLSFGVSALASIPLSVYFFVLGKPYSGVCAIGCAFALAGLALLMLPAVVYTARGTARLMKNILLGIKSFFVGKEKKA